jgi:hypothetical protein
MRANRLYAIAVTLGLLITVSSAWAGPNAGGTLIVHHSGYAERYSQPSDCSGVTLANFLLSV